jgi:hypothetical protein
VIPVGVRITAAGSRFGAARWTTLILGARRITVFSANHGFVAGESQFAWSESRFRSHFFSGQDKSSPSCPGSNSHVTPTRERVEKSGNYNFIIILTSDCLAVRLGSSRSTKHHENPIASPHSLVSLSTTVQVQHHAIALEKTGQPFDCKYGYSGTRLQIE